MALFRSEGAVGMGSSLGRGDVTGSQGQIQILQGGTAIIKVRLDESETPPGTCSPHLLETDYRTPSGAVTGPGGGGTATSYTEAVPPFNEGYCILNQTVEVRFRLGTWDSIALTRAADGFYEVRINGGVQVL